MRSDASSASIISSKALSALRTSGAASRPGWFGPRSGAGPEETYEREPHDLLGLQAGLGAAIARQIELLLSPQRVFSIITSRQTQNPEAYDLLARSGRAGEARDVLATLEQSSRHRHVPLRHDE